MTTIMITMMFTMIINDDANYNALPDVSTGPWPDSGGKLWTTPASKCRSNAKQNFAAFEAERLWQCFESTACLWIDFNRHNFPPSLKIICSLLSPPCGGGEIFPVHPFPPPSFAINFHFLFPPPIISISTTNDFHFHHHNNFRFSISTINLFHFHQQYFHFHLQ